MASPAIALRFRDTTPGVDTIDAHRAILRREGAVWWGWWKKDFEDDHTAYFKSLPTGNPIEILIIDRSTKRMFGATSIRLSVGRSEEVDLVRVPEYYRTHAQQVFGWFLITKIEQTDFIESIAERFGDHTLIQIDSIDDMLSEKVAANASAFSKSCLLHLSDLHFGADYAFITQPTMPRLGDTRKSLTECLSLDLKRIGVCNDIAAVVVTGDFTSRGDWGDGTRADVLREFEALRVALNLKPEQVVAVPGNHDIERYPPGSSIDLANIVMNNQTSYRHEREFRTFVEELVGRSWKESLNYVRRLNLRTADMLVCVLNSCTILATEWTEYGFVGNSGLDAIGKLREELIQRPTFKLIALHHHLLPVIGVEAPNNKGVTLTLDASDLLDAAQRAGVHIALHGHQHMPRLARYQTIPLLGGGSSTQPLNVVSNGSTGVARPRLPGSERNTYCVFRFDENDVHLWMREIRPDGKEGASLFEGHLDIRPERPTKAAEIFC